MSTPAPDLLDRLRDMGCDREPFTPAHKDCICRLTNEAANEIERLRNELDKSEAHATEARNVLAIRDGKL